jgi:hypothetical protein
MDIIAPVIARDPTSLQTRARVAAAEQSIGTALVAQARRTPDGPLRRNRYRDARRMFERARVFWLDMQQKNPGVEDSDSTVDLLTRQITAIDREIAGLAPHSASAQ